ESLPDYMIPAHFVCLPSFPQTPNNKVDRKALPKPAKPEPVSRSKTLAQPVAKGGLEESLLALCAEMLRIDSVALNDNFFKLGGDSLLATQIVTRINDRYAIKLPISTIFEVENFAALTASVKVLCDTNRLAAEESSAADDKDLDALPRAPRDKQAPVSYAQRRMWLIDHLYGAGAAYNISNTVRLRGKINTDALAWALNQLIRRHETLRTVFPADIDGPKQKILSFSPIELDIRNLEKEPESQQAVILKERIKQLVEERHDLAAGPVFRCELVKLSSREYVFIVIFNHIIYDNIWSSRLFFEELSKFYGAYPKGLDEQPLLPELQRQFIDYACWEQSQIESGAFSGSLEFWRKELSLLPEPLQLPTDKKRVGRPSYIGQRVEFTIEKELKNSLGKIAKAQSATSFMLLLAAWQLLLNRYSGQQDILLGTTTGRRHRSETEKMIGLFINNLVVRTQILSEQTFSQLLSSVRKKSVQIFAHDQVPFEFLVSQLKPERKSGMAPFFQHFFIHRNIGSNRWTLPGLDVEPMKIARGGSKFDITLSVLEDDDKISGTLEYATDLFERSSMERMAANYIELLSSIAANPDQLLSELSIIAPNERQQL
ncbi:condensation domain-containing protein, partial [Teredinibacter waterburyi]|uniref:condensation domain-containing protein n=1 Tax=Teredinibacter waterburyi TaxID=1500538 RepID=UPI001FE8EA1E